jgi:hypothetical protein
MTMANILQNFYAFTSEPTRERIAYSNGYEVSIVHPHRVTDDRWEAAVLRDGQLVYNTVLTYDVERFYSREMALRFADFAGRLQPDGTLSAEDQAAFEHFDAVERWA